MKSSARLTKLIEIYKIFAVIVLNTILIILILNLVLSRRQERRAAWEYKPENYVDRQVVYPNYNPADIALLMKETWEKPFQYEPWVGFREKPRHGRFVNISEEGFRYEPNQPMSLHDQALKIFVFGGSSTFGYGVEDSRTIPAYLQKHLSAANPGKIIRVYNFGRAYYYSATELVLLLELLSQEKIPNIAIFIDGWNEGQVVPYYSDEMTFLFDSYNYTPRNFNKMAFEKIPLVSYIQEQLDKSQPSFQETRWHDNPEDTRNEYLRNRRIINSLGKEFNFTAYFFIHPVPGYRNSFAKHKFWKKRKPDGLAAMNAKIALLERTENSENAFSMTGLLEHYPQQPFVDAMHFTPAVCDLQAEFIAKKIRIQ